LLKNTILLFLGGFLVVVIAIIAVGGSGKVLATWKQPNTLNYNSYGPYNLSVVEKGRIWNTLGNYRYYSIIISADSNSAYGHSKIDPDETTRELEIVPFRKWNVGGPRVSPKGEQTV